MTRLSIVIPTIHRPTLPRAIDSVLQQDSPAELIVVGDTEGSGAGLTRNRGVQLVRTPWVGFLDDDDRLAYTYVSTMKAHFHEADLVLCRIRMNHTDPSIPTVPPAEVTNPMALRRGEAGMSFCVRTELALEYPFVSERDFGSGEDFEFIRRIRDAGHKILILPDALYLVRPPE